MHTPGAQIGCVGLSCLYVMMYMCRDVYVRWCICAVMQAPQSKSVSQDEVISFVRELEAIDPDYHPPDAVADVLRCSFICPFACRLSAKHSLHCLRFSTHLHNHYSSVLSSQRQSCSKPCVLYWTYVACIQTGWAVLSDAAGTWVECRVLLE